MLQNISPFQINGSWNSHASLQSPPVTSLFRQPLHFTAVIDVMDCRHRALATLWRNLCTIHSTSERQGESISLIIPTAEKVFTYLQQHIKNWNSRLNVNNRNRTIFHKVKKILCLTQPKERRRLVQHSFSRHETVFVRYLKTPITMETLHSRLRL